MNGNDAANVSNGMAEGKDKLRARIALAVQDRISPGECPSDEELATFTDGVLGEEDREKVLAHLNACPDCRSEWIEVTSVLEHDAEESRAIDFKKTAAYAKDQERCQAGWRGVKEAAEKAFFRLPRSVHAGIGLALAASLILAVWYGAHLPQSEMNTLIAQSYSYFSEMNTRQGRLDPESFRLALPLPGEGSGSA